jgi:hypothetical protein
MRNKSKLQRFVFHPSIQEDHAASSKKTKTFSVSFALSLRFTREEQMSDRRNKMSQVCHQEFVTHL